MPVHFQAWIERTDLQDNPNTLYLFGDNGARVGYGGQARAMRGEPNAVGIATKRDPSTFWSDADYSQNCTMIDRDLAPVFEHVQQGGVVVIPVDGLGTGLSQLPTRAPKTYRYLMERLRALIALDSAATAVMPKTFRG